MPCSLAPDGDRGTVRLMPEPLVLAIHLLVTFAKLLRPGGARALAAESLLLKHQLLISNRCRQRAPNLTTLDRFVLGLTTLFMCPGRIQKCGVLIKPATLLKFHRALVDRKYHRLFSSSGRRRKPGPKGPSVQLIAAIVELKRRNPRFGCYTSRSRSPMPSGWISTKMSFVGSSRSTTGLCRAPMSPPCRQVDDVR